VKYKIIKSNLEQLELLVKEELKSGWKLNGGAIHYHTNENEDMYGNIKPPTFFFAQTLIKED